MLDKYEKFQRHHRKGATEWIINFDRYRHHLAALELLPVSTQSDGRSNLLQQASHQALQLRSFQFSPFYPIYET